MITKRSYSFVNTPIHIFLSVIGPICALMIGVLMLDMQEWIRVSAALVLSLSFYGFLRGYVRRLAITDDGVCFRNLMMRFVLPWNEIKRIDRYIPSGGVNGVKYVFVSLRDEEPRGKWEIYSQVVQVQDRPGLLDELRAAWKIGRKSSDA